MWIREDERTWIQKFCMNVLKQGPLPEHVGIILDGNRRYAQKSSLGKLDGHVKGFEKLTEALRWFWEFGVKELTVYAFSIENFKRPKEEVDGIMKLAKEKIEQLLEEIERLQERGICVQVVGDWCLIPEDLKPSMAKLMVLTKNNTQGKLNVAFAYTSRNEITRGVKNVETQLFEGEIEAGEVNQKLLEDSFNLLPSRPLDLLVRTSGETRLSDFLLWQSSETFVFFTDVLWPEFTIWHLMVAMFHYQVNCTSLKQIMQASSGLPRESFSCGGASASKNSLISSKCKSLWKQLEKDAGVVSS